IFQSKDLPLRLCLRYAAESSQGKATIIATGPGARSKNVLLPEYGSTKVILEGKEYYLFRDGDILGKYLTIFYTNRNLQPNLSWQKIQHFDDPM
uniref:Uncharacterized protein n=1 Tax=Callorhinchus milii TaxID=7868 RepID=A0A4W3IK99_CALMI